MAPKSQCATAPSRICGTTQCERRKFLNASTGDAVMQFGMIEYAPMKRILSPACFLLLLAGCQAYPAGGAIADIPGFAFEEDVSEMGESSLGARPAELFNDPKPLKKERAAFQRALAAFGRNTGGKRALYEKNIDAIGANGILDGIQTLWPTCHSEAHD